MTERRVYHISRRLRAGVEKLLLVPWPSLFYRSHVKRAPNADVPLFVPTVRLLAFVPQGCERSRVSTALKCADASCQALSRDVPTDLQGT